MLDMMRRHAGWGLKVVLGIIIVTFVFFFGYSTIQQENRDAAAVKVGSETIRLSKYRFFYEMQHEKMRETFKETEIPDFLMKSIQDSTRQQLVQRSLFKQFSDSLGLKVSDQELAAFITKEKDFDPVQYKNFITNFYNRQGFSYEELVREELLMQKFQDWAKNIEKIEEPASQTTWTFETALLNGADKQAVAEEIQKLWSQGKEATPILKQNKIEVTKQGPITLAERQMLFTKPLTLEEYENIFSLSKPKSGIAKSIQKGSQFLVLRLIERKTPPHQQTSSLPKRSLVDIWFRDFANKTKVESFLPAEES